MVQQANGQAIAEARCPWLYALMAEVHVTDPRHLLLNFNSGAYNYEREKERERERERVLIIAILAGVKWF